MGIGVSAGIRVGDGDPTMGPPRHFEDALFVVVRIEQRIRHITVAVRPAIDGDRRDIASARKAGGAEHAIELIADARLEIGKCHRKQFLPADAKLRAGIES